MTWNGKIESIDDTTANLFTINISLSPPFDRCSILYVESRDYRLPTISTRPIAFGFDDTRRFPYSTSFHFEGRAPFLLARITYGNHACTPRNKRSETTFAQFLSLWIRSAIKRTSSSSVATVTLGPRSRRVDFSRQGRCCSTRSV